MRWSRRAGIRHPKTNHERKANQDCIWNRPSRNPHRIPTAYDDLWIIGERSWKSHRKTQYKPKDI
jgi:hypothetical protein